MCSFLAINQEADIADIDGYYILGLAALTIVMLSPLAIPFLPESKWKLPSFEIFNAGVPTLVPVDKSQVVRGISDEALEQHFPPDAQDAAELDAADSFVRTLATLDIMEEREERSRETYSSFPKRWETRRLEGLLGRPKPSRSVVVTNTDLQRAINEPAPTDATSLVPKIRSTDRFRKLEHLEMTRAQFKSPAKNVPIRNKRMMGLRRHSPIHQPRKSN